MFADFGSSAEAKQPLGVFGVVVAMADSVRSGSRRGRPAGPPPPTPARVDAVPRTPRGPGGSSSDTELERIEDIFGESPEAAPYLSRSSSSERETDPPRRRTRTRTRSARAKAASSVPKAKAPAAAPPPVPPPRGPQNVDLQFFYDDYREYRRWAVIEQNNLRDTVEAVAWMICSRE